MSATGIVRTAGERSSGSIRVASVPSGHVYVRHLSDPDDDGTVVRLPDIAAAGQARGDGGRR